MKYLVFGVMYGAAQRDKGWIPTETVGIYFAGVMQDGKFYPRHEPIPEKQRAKKK